MHRALLASLTLHGALLAVLLMQQGSVAQAPTALTVQLLPPAPVAPTVRAAPATAPVSRASKASSRAPAPVPSRTVATPAQAQTPVAAATVAQAVASPAANPLPGHASVMPAPTVPALATAAAGSVTATREGSSRYPSPLADRAARVLQMPDPDYPPLSRERGEQGVVMLQLVVDATGRLGEVSVLRSSGFARLDKAARAAVQRWRFQPAIEDGQPVAAQLTLPVRFTLDEN